MMTIYNEKLFLFAPLRVSFLILFYMHKRGPSVKGLPYSQSITIN